MAHAWEVPATQVTVPMATGIPQHRMVRMSSAGLAVLPSGSTIGRAVVGVVTSSGTTGSTVSPQYGTIGLPGGVYRVTAAASTRMAPGSWVSASSAGMAQASTNPGDRLVGVLMHGASTNVGGGHLVPIMFFPVMESSGSEANGSILG